MPRAGPEPVRDLLCRALMLVALACAASWMPARAQALLAPEVESVDLWPHVRVLSDPSRSLTVEQVLARRDAFAAGAPSGSLAPTGRGFRDLRGAGAEPPDHPDAAFADDDLPVRQLPGRPAGARSVRTPGVPRVRVPGERLFRDGDRVTHGRFGDGVVVTSKLTRDDEEVTVAFRAGGVKTLLASIANLEIAG